MPKLYPFQRAGVRGIEQFGGRVLLADEMGLGKTVQALWYLRRNPDALPAVVVCPASVKWAWDYETRQHLQTIPEVLSGRTASHPGLIETHPKLVIVNYDILTEWLPYILQMHPQTLIIDECQYIQNTTTQRTKAVQLLAKRRPHVLALSGTPLTNRPIELLPTLQILWPRVYRRKADFAYRYCGRHRDRWGWNDKGATNLDELRASLRQHGMIRRRKRDVLQELPDKIRRVIPVEIQHPEEYAEARDHFSKWVKANFSHKRAARTKRVEALAKSGYLMRLVGRLKCRAVVQWVQHFLDTTDEKLVFFAYHKKMIQAIQRRVPTKQVLIDGSVTGRHRTAAVYQFQHDPNTRLFVGNLRAAGVGITLTAARTVAFAELWWRPGDFLQAEDRPHRIGQKRTVWVNYLIAAGTFEELLCRNLQQKQKNITAVLDGGNGVGDIDILDLLMKTLGGKQCQTHY